MPIGTSSGEYFEDKWDYTVRNPVINPDVTPEFMTNDQNVVHPNQVETGKELDRIEVDPTTGTGIPIGLKRVEITGGTIDSRMPLEASTEPAGALESSEGSQVPGNVDWTKMNQPTGSVSMSDVGDSPLDRELIEFRRRAAEPVKHFRDMSQEEIDAAIEEAINIGMSAGPGTMIGVKARVFNKNALAQAQIMAANGVHPDVIFNKTGSFKGSDGRWRQEIDDSVANFKSDWSDPLKSAEEAFKKEGIALDTAYGPGGKNNIYKLRKWKSEEKINPESLPADLAAKWAELKQGIVSTKLSEVVDHPELFKAYPELKDVKVRFDPNNPSAHWDKTNNEIVVGELFRRDKGTLYHEIQHAVQDIEGFAKGTFPGKAAIDFKLKLQDDVMPFIDRLKELYKAGKERNLDEHETAERNHLTYVITKFNEYVKAATDEAYQFYMKSAGETEARNVDIRVLLKDKERRQMPPWYTEDLPASQQIPLVHPNIATAYGIFDTKTGKTVK